MPIRLKAVCIVTRGDAVLLSFAIDPDTGARYGRLLGGGVETGERAEEAIRRELREEIGVELCDVRRLGVVENVFRSEQRQIHEVIFVFAASFADRLLYRQETFVVNEAICDGPATWIPTAQLRHGEIAVYPPELVELMDLTHGRSNPASHSPV